MIMVEPRLKSHLLRYEALSGCCILLFVSKICFVLIANKAARALLDQSSWFMGLQQYFLTPKYHFAYPFIIFDPSNHKNN
jgi:hypothetical protein